MRNPETPTQNDPQKFSQPTFLKPLDQNLFQAILSQDLEEIKIAIDKGGNVNAVEEGEEKRSILMYVAQNAKLNTIDNFKLIIAKGADVNYQAPNGFSLFTIALFNIPFIISSFIENLNLPSKWSEDFQNQLKTSDLKELSTIKFFLVTASDFVTNASNINDENDISNSADKNNETAMKKKLENLNKLLSLEPIVDNIIKSKEKEQNEQIEQVTLADILKFNTYKSKREKEAFTHLGVLGLTALTIIGTGILFSPTTAFEVAVAAVTIPTCKAIYDEFKNGQTFYNSCKFTLTNFKFELKHDLDIIIENFKTNFTSSLNNRNTTNSNSVSM